MPGTRGHSFKDPLPLMGHRQVVRAAQVAELVISLPAHIYQMIKIIKRFSFSADGPFPTEIATRCAIDGCSISITLVILPALLSCLGAFDGSGSFAVPIQEIRQSTGLLPKGQAAGSWSAALSLVRTKINV
jgi:hypothetical protein